MDDGRQLIRLAQEAELRGDRAGAAALLRKAAQGYERQGSESRAEQLLRQADRLAPTEAVAPTEELQPAESPSSPAGPDRPKAFFPTQTKGGAGPVPADPRVEAWCSFCLRPGRDVGRLATGPTDAYICRACVAEASSLLGEGP
jgi:hypothetical protein